LTDAVQHQVLDQVRQAASGQGLVRTPDPEDQPGMECALAR
jgi:hypothetical protein